MHKQIRLPFLHKDLERPSGDEHQCCRETDDQGTERRSACSRLKDIFSVCI